jgi:LmbE family N-acetylglucosaminyl deacetylase
VRPIGPVTVVSPHLDDAVLSCGRLLCSCPGSTVVTVFAGGTGSSDRVTEWDARCRFTQGQDVMAARRSEDCRALAVLSAAPDWMVEKQDEYRTTEVEFDTLATALRAAVEKAGNEVVIAPLGLAHVDHRIVSSVCLKMSEEGVVGSEWLFYADLPYALRGRSVQHRLEEIGDQGVLLEPMEMTSGSRLRKLEAVMRYKSQRYGLGTKVMVSTVMADERYWRRSLEAPSPLDPV